MNDHDFLAALAAIVGPGQVLTDPADTAPYLTDWRGRYSGAARAVVRPGSTGEVADIAKLCAAHGVAMVPQGGNTGLCGGATPDASGAALVVNLSRMNRIRRIDPANLALVAEAGCTLASIQEAAREVGCLFPLSLASEGTCEIGGNLSTNAGGVQVLRYGNTRELTLGLEVVLPDGRIWNGLRALRKDNTGYDLKHLFVGAEGTLGFITAAALKLFPLPRAAVTTWLAVPDPAAAVSLLSRAQQRLGARVTAFELVSRVCLELVLRHIPNTRDPLAESSPWYVLLEASDGGSEEALMAEVEALLEAALEAGEASDGAIAQSGDQARQLWALRENISEAQKIDGISIKHDISLPVSAIPGFLDAAGEELTRTFPGVRIVAFGHLGDGNLHYNLSKPEAQANAVFIDSQPEANRLVHDRVVALEGSISAEHGLGQLKREEIRRYKSAVELDLMRAVKAAIDPTGLMNPGKVL
ncbi:FAD-binding oxidoreductase [Oryzomicrobium sp.]|uniref:FAD-binding oxidoreductase n=1 Tax=Oryzomicrobium sp. TaxID=1911578 RepID=UPI002FE1D65B